MAVLDGTNLLFDATHGAQQVVALSSGGRLNFNLMALVDWRGPLRNSTLTITDGVSIFASFGELGHFPGSHGEAVVTGSGSTWNCNDYLFVGSLGTGKLTVSDGGNVIAGIVNVGMNNGTQGEVVVTGTGSTFTATVDVMAGATFLPGGSGGTGTISVGDGGTLIVSRSLYLGTGSTLNLQAEGTINAKNFTAFGGVFNFLGGVFNFTGSVASNLIVPQSGTISGNNVSPAA